MNIELFEGQSCLVHVKLLEEWEVYGGTPKGEFMAEREGSESVLVTVPPMEADFTPLVPYELFARRSLDGREWLVLSGQIHVRRRYSDVGGGISPVEYFVEPQLVEDGISSSPQITVGIPGPQGPQGEKGDTGATAYQLAAQYGFTGTEAEWVAELQGAQAAANSARDSAATATTAAATATEASVAAAKSAAEGDTQQNLAVATLGDTPMELLPTSYAEWTAENSAALNAAEKTTLTILLNAAGAAAITMPAGFKKLVVCNTGNVGILKKAVAEKSLYIYERASTVQAWNMAEINAPVVTLVYPELASAKDAFYSINASRLNLVFPKLRSVGSYFLKHNIIGAKEVRFYMPKLAGSCSLFPSNALSAASILSLAKTLPTVATPQTITIGASGDLQNDENFQMQLAAALAGKNWTFDLNYI